MTQGNMVTAQDAIAIYRRLVDNGIRVWLTGGWGIDALLGEQARPHKDLDLILLIDNQAVRVHLQEICDYVRLVSPDAAVHMQEAI